MAKKTKRAAQPRNPTSSRDIERWLKRATQQLIRSDYAGVIATAQRVLRAPATHEQRAEALGTLGGAYAMQDQHEQSFQVLSEALKLTPDDAMFWYNRGMAARFTMRVGQSLRDFERAQQADTDGVLAPKLAAALPLARSGAASERALRGPDFTLDQLIAQEELFQRALRSMEQHHWAEAEPLFRETIALGDVLPQPQGNLALCLVMQRRFDEAEVVLRRALEIDPDYAIARQNLAALPFIRASGKLPEMRISDPFAERSGKQKLSILREGESEFLDLDR